MEAAGLAVGVASLFATCIDCFELFKAGSSLRRDYEILLVKLDVEKERLLVWGELAGVGIEHDPEDSSAVWGNHGQDLVRRCLTSIKILLEDSKKLQEKYGLHPVPSEEVIAHGQGLSSNAFKRLRLRLRGHNQGPGPIDKTLWAIHDGKRFQVLVEDLKDLVDSLMRKVPRSQALGEQTIQNDIACLVDDVPQLSLIEEACEDTYSVWSESARVAIDASERGTGEESSRIGGRSVPARDDHTALVSASQPAKDWPTSFTVGEKLVFLDTRTRVFIVSTGPCRKESNCDITMLGPSSFDSRSGHIPYGSINLQTSPGDRIANYIKPQEFTHTDLEAYLDQQEEFKAREIEMGHDVRGKKLRHSVQVYVYTAPCACQVRSALEICAVETRSPLVEYIARVDPRLNTCCLSDSSKIERLVAIVTHARDLEVQHSWHEESSFEYDRERVAMMKALDQEWLDRWAYDYGISAFPSDSPVPTEYLSSIALEHSKDRTCAGISIVGEADYTVKMLEAPAFKVSREGRPVRDHEMWMMHQTISQPEKSYRWQTRFLGGYSSYTR